MDKIKIEEITDLKNSFDWAVTFNCPACGEYNSQTSVNDLSDMKCEKCGANLDASDANRNRVDAS